MTTGIHHDFPYGLNNLKAFLLNGWKKWSPSRDFLEDFTFDLNLEGKYGRPHVIDDTALDGVNKLPLDPALKHFILHIGSQKRTPYRLSFSCELVTAVEWRVRIKAPILIPRNGKIADDPTAPPADIESIFDE